MNVTVKGVTYQLTAEWQVFFLCVCLENNLSLAGIEIVDSWRLAS